MTCTVEPQLSEPRLTGCSLYPAKHSRAYALVRMRTAHVFQLMRTYCINRVMATARSKKRKRVLSIESKIAIVDHLKRGEANVKLAAESVRSRRMKLRYDSLPR